MRAIRRTNVKWPLLACVIVAALGTQSSDASRRDLLRTLHDASRALQAGNAALFLGCFDPSRFPGYARLQEDVVALTRQSDIASSIEVQTVEARDDNHAVTVDWLLQIRPAGGPGPAEQRRETISLRIQMENGKPRIVGLTPADFFRPR